jgi:HEAT repeat protein
MTPLELDVAADPASVAAVEAALRALGKAYRAVQLYLPNNPTRHRALDDARVAFERLWPQVDVLIVDVREAAFLWGGRVVFQETERGAEALPWLLFRDGIRQIEFADGFEREELEAFLAVLQRARMATPDDDDLITLLWVADFGALRYRHVELGDHGESTAERDASGDASAAPGRPPAIVAAESMPPGEGPPSPFVRIDDFDGTLYFLTPAESAALAAELRAEYATDRVREVVTILADIVERHGDEPDQLEALGYLESLTVQLLATGDLATVSFLLAALRGVSTRIAPSPAVAARLEALPDRLSEPEAVTQLLRALDDDTRLPDRTAVDDLIAALRPAALRPLAAWLGAATGAPLRERIAKATARLGGTHTAALVALLDDADPTVVAGILPIVAGLGTPAAVPALTRLVRGADAALRVQVVGVLGTIGTTGALQAIERALDDQDRDVRVAALRAITARQHVGAMPWLAQAVRRKELRGADLGEKMALFEAFGTLCGDAGVGVLDTLLNARALLGPREPAEVRACAARALGLVGSPRALDALRRAADAKDAVVRGAVARALRGVA